MLGNVIKRFVHNVAETTKLVSVSKPVDRVITLTWDDGKTGRFPIIWLRDTSPDDKTYTISPAMTARNLVMNEFDVKQSPVDMKLSENGKELLISWPGDVLSRYDSEWLRLRNPTDEEARKHRRKIYLFPEETWDMKTIEGKLKKFSHEAILNDDETLHDFLTAVCLDGIAVVQGAPKHKLGAVEAIGQRIGLIHRTHFGKVFEVSTKPDASNMAYASNGGLPFHTDFTSLAQPPQLQMLHMLQKAAEGGRSLFVDGFHVAKLLREERPDVFSILSKHSMEYIEEGFDRHDNDVGDPQTFTYNMCARHKVIKLDEEKRVIKIQFGNAMRSWFFDCPPEEVQKIYDALKTFTDYCYDEKNMFKFALEEGDTVLWANTRLLHTRDAFRNSGGRGRTLTGCYFQWDNVKSRVREISRRLHLPSEQPSA